MLFVSIDCEGNLLEKSIIDTKKDVLNYIESKTFNIFFGDIKIKEKVTWDNDYEWKDFLEVAEQEEIKT